MDYTKFTTWYDKDGNETTDPSKFHHTNTVKLSDEISVRIDIFDISPSHLRIQSITTGQFLWDGDKLVSFMPYWPQEKETLLLKAAPEEHVANKYKFYIFGGMVYTEMVSDGKIEILDMPEETFQEMFGDHP